MHDIRVDCDGDTLLLTVDQTGAACHTGSHSCFDTEPLEFSVALDLPNDDTTDEGR